MKDGEGNDAQVIYVNCSVRMMFVVLVRTSPRRNRHKNDKTKEDSAKIKGAYWRVKIAMKRSNMLDCRDHSKQLLLVVC